MSRLWLGSAGIGKDSNGQLEVPDDRVVDELDAGGVDPDVVGGPSDPELVAAGGQLPDQVRKSPVVGIAAGLGAQQGDGVAGDLVPVAEELGGVRVEEDEPGVVGRPDRVGVDRREQRVPEGVGGQDVQASVEHERGRAGHRVDDALHRGPDVLRGGPAARRAGAASGADQVEQMRPLGLIELQCVRDAVDDALGDAGGVAALEPGVVLAGDAGEDGDLLAAQARDPPALAAIDGQPGLRGTDPGPPGAQELPDLAADAAADVAVVAPCLPCLPLYERLPSRWGSLSVPLSSGSATCTAPAGSVDSAAADDAVSGTQINQKDVHRHD